MRTPFQRIPFDWVIDIAERHVIIFTHDEYEFTNKYNGCKKVEMDLGIAAS